MIRVLHVDDSFDEQELIKYRLVKVCNDLEITWTRSGREALDLLDGEGFDCVLSDFQMPDMDGLELLRELRVNKSKVPFIFLTGQGNEEFAAEAFRTGADDYFTKEIGFAHYDRLTNSIRRLVDSHREAMRHRMAEEALRTLVQATSSQTGLPFFEKLLKHLSQLLETRYAFIGEIPREKKNIIRTLAFWDSGGLSDNIEFDHSSKPCNRVAAGQTLFLASGVCEKYPDDEYLNSLNVESYMGVPLVISNGDVTGLIVLMNDQELREPELSLNLLKIFASRAAAELERIHIVEALKESERQYRILMDEAADGILTFDLTGKVLTANIKACELLGYTRAEIETRDVWDLIAVDDPDELQQRIDELVKGEAFITERRFRKKDRTLRPLEVSSKMLEDGRIQSIFREIGSRRKVEVQAENAINGSGNGYREVINSLDIGVLALRKDGTVRVANDAARNILNISSNLISDMNLTSFIVDKHRPQIEHYFGGHATGSKEFKVKARTISGEGVNLRLKISHFKPESTEKDGWIVILQDR